MVVGPSFQACKACIFNIVPIFALGFLDILAQHQLFELFAAVLGGEKNGNKHFLGQI